MCVVEFSLFLLRFFFSSLCVNISCADFGLCLRLFPFWYAMTMIYGQTIVTKFRVFFCIWLFSDELRSGSHKHKRLTTANLKKQDQYLVPMQWWQTTETHTHKPIQGTYFYVSSANPPSNHRKVVIHSDGLNINIEPKSISVSNNLQFASHSIRQMKQRDGKTHSNGYCKSKTVAIKMRQVVSGICDNLAVCYCFDALWTEKGKNHTHSTRALRNMMGFWYCAVAMQIQQSFRVFRHKIFITWRLVLGIVWRVLRRAYILWHSSMFHNISLSLSLSILFRCVPIFSGHNHSSTKKKNSIFIALNFFHGFHSLIRLFRNNAMPYPIQNKYSGFGFEPTKHHAPLLFAFLTQPKPSDAHHSSRLHAE